MKPYPGQDCYECGAPIIQNEDAGYAVCPNGCGKLLPPLPSHIRRRNHALLLMRTEVLPRLTLEQRQALGFPAT